MYVVGLTGGIGSGKTTFASLLAERGASVIDADLLGREALQPGKPAWHSVMDQFGDAILAAGSMEVDRRRLADLVFADKAKLAALNAIVHPVIVRGIAERLEKLQATDEIVIVDAALIVDLGLDRSMDALVVVDAAPSLRKKRLITQRAMDPIDVEARIGSQVAHEELTERADIVVENDGTLENLASEADRVWKELQERASA